MLEKRVLDFIKREIIDLNDFVYTTDSDENHFYVEFSEVLGEEKVFELTFKLINDTLFYHSMTFGWKPVEKGSNNKYFWIDLLT